MKMKRNKHDLVSATLETYLKRRRYQVGIFKTKTTIHLQINITSHVVYYHPPVAWFLEFFFFVYCDGCVRSRLSIRRNVCLLFSNICSLDFFMVKDSRLGGTVSYTTFTCFFRLRFCFTATVFRFFLLFLWLIITFPSGY